MSEARDREAAEARFQDVFSHLGAVAAYARRRGNRDADGLAAEVMTIAWRRLADVPVDDTRPWLYATARNLLLAERRRAARVPKVAAPDPVAEPDLAELDPGLARAIRSLSPLHRAALLLTA